MQSKSFRKLAIAAVCAATVSFVHLTRAEDGRREWKAPNRASSLKNPTNLDAKSIAAGKAIYAKECASCHGEKGKGDGPDAADLSHAPPDFAAPAVTAQSDGEIFWKITEGRKPMPRYQKMLADEERWNVVNYIRSITPKPQ